MTKKKERCKTKEISSIVLPEQAGLRDAYLSALRLTLCEGHNDHWLGTLVDFITSNSSVTKDTAENQCKQLSRYGLLNFISSSILGHKFRVMVFKKYGENVSLVSSWKEFNQLVSEALSKTVESDLLKVHRIMKRGCASPLPNAMEEAEHIFSNNSTGRVITPGSDTIQSKVEFTEKMSPSDVCGLAEDQLVNEQKAKDRHQEIP